MAKGKKDHVRLLKKSLDDLKQSPRQNNCMIEQDFARSEYDCYVYLKEVCSGSLLYLLLYVER